MAAELTGVQAYQATLRAAQKSIQPSPSDETSGLNFGNMVSEAVTQTDTALRSAEQMTAAAATGEADLVDVVTAVSAAELTLETVVAVRDEVVKAYQEIMRMPI